ncbi:hypothetical protein H4R18_005413 [Coemansia javaensis]|uniref:Uncharacterized protein n=1 Tax=Coemansia javaensis TaxID=2761396 RepID=A0A9W8H986_9FUNG|nr:hypothetical protein H4R18_005413 [Coemansia javaensis]
MNTHFIGIYRGGQYQRSVRYNGPIDDAVNNTPRIKSHLLAAGVEGNPTIVVVSGGPKSKNLYDVKELYGRGHSVALIHCPASPLETGLRSLSANIHDGTGKCTQLLLQERFTLVVRYLLLRTPTLTSFSSASLPAEDIARLVEAHVTEYPHLAGIRL